MELNYFRNRLFNLLNDSQGMGILNIDADEKSHLISVHTEDGNIFEIICRQAEDNESIQKERKLTVYYGPGDYQKAPPQILLQGKWLKRIGFSTGDKITVKCRTGQMVITKDRMETDNGK